MNRWKNVYSFSVNLNNFVKNNFSLTQVIIFSIVFFLVGFAIAWVLRTVVIAKLKRNHVGTEGLLESERLIKETLRKESARAFQMKETVEAELGKKLKEAEIMIRQMDQDILLLQKSNEETEALLQTTQPELYNLKIKFLEANNTIARLKSQIQQLTGSK